MGQNFIEGKNEKICSRFSETVSHKIDFNGHRDRPPAWELRFLYLLPGLHQ